MKVKEVPGLPTAGEADAGQILEYRPDLLWVTYDARDGERRPVWPTLLFGAL